uniref:RBBP4-1 n=1 Tax=Schmidtea mediterranea TaxID=79327 RepID=H9CXT2_SCHMD|nr:RBBP4-1 [Schmidtea mediterranea]
MMNDDTIEERRIWKINCPLMYNLAHFDTLDWPSFTCQWLPFEEKHEDHTIYKILLGTHADEEENKLIYADYIISNSNEADSIQINGADNKSRLPLNGKLVITKTVNHKGDVNRARYMPQNSSIVATKSSEKDSFIYSDGNCLLTLSGHSDEGYGISWNQQVEGRLLTCSFDQTICAFDISQSAGGSTLNPARTITGHQDKVEDVCWHPAEANIFGSVGDDQRLLIWDYRRKEASSSSGPVQQVVAHAGDANCLSWHPVTSCLLLTGGADGLVHLWDQRKLVSALHVFDTEASVYRVAWSPLQETLFLSAGLQHKIHIWDVEKIGDDVLSYDEEDRFPAELAMIHSGHADAVTDIDWHPYLKATVASVAEDNMVNVWQIKDSIFADE